MKKFRVYGIITGTKYLGEFEAETADEAEDKASSSEANAVSLCHQCSGEFDLDEHCAGSFIVEEAT